MHTVAVALIGAVATIALARVAQRHAVSARLRRDRLTRFRIPAFARDRVVAALDAAALRSSPEEAVEIWCFASGIAAVVGFGLSPAVGVLAGTGVAFGLPVLLVSAGSRRARLAAVAVPDALEQVGAELRAGGTIATALAAIRRADGPLAGDMARVETRVGLGASLGDALQAWVHERPVAGVDAAAGALALTTSVGGRAADALDGLAASLRDRLAVAAEVRALSAQARYSAWVIGLGPLGYLAASAAIDPGSAHALFATTVGRVCAAVGMGLEVLGAVWMRAILRGADRG